MTSAVSELLVLTIRLAALQLRFGFIAAEVAGLGVRQVITANADRAVNVPDRTSSDAEVDAAAQAIKRRLLAGRDMGFRNMLQVNFPDEEIRAIAEVALAAAAKAQ